MAATPSPADRAVLPYGSWPSQIPAELLVAGAATPTDTWAEDGLTWWSQARPAEGGRIQLVRRDPDGVTRDLLPDGFSARTRVHEYGGGAWWVHAGEVFFVSWTDQRLYRLADAGADGAQPIPLTPEPEHPHGLRYADGRVTPDGTTVICVRERHPAPGPDGSEAATDVVNEIVALPARVAAGAEPDQPAVLFCGPDFVAAPRISPDGTRLAWLSWDHPDMPWDRTSLWVARLQGSGAGTTLSDVRRIAGGPDESLLQPEWGPDGTLHVVSDRSDWWNVYRVAELGGAERPGAVELVPVYPVEAEVGLPAWVFGQSRYVIAPDGTLWLTYAGPAGAHLVSLLPSSQVPVDVVPQLGGDAITTLSALRFDGSRLVAIAGQQAAEAAIVELEAGALSGSVSADRSADRPGAGGAGAVAVLCPPRDLRLDPAGIARPRQVTFPSDGGRSARARFYLPASATTRGPAGELPPLLVLIHGGPTAATDPSFRLSTQFWTSRGFAVVDVDYGGSTGYGRPYRRLLDDGWGVVDVQDACAAASWLAEQGLVDRSRMAIRGGSAGGFTTLAALATRDVFAAGASHYGVADLGALARDTHKFESRYLDRLVGPYPEAEQVYRERSPLSHSGGFDRPLIVLQGSDDPVVPPAQAELIVAALQAKAVPHAYLLFEGEQHGFRRAENIVRAISAELYFYSRVFGCEPADPIEPVPIAFADRLASSVVNQVEGRPGPPRP